MIKLKDIIFEVADRNDATYPKAVYAHLKLSDDKFLNAGDIGKEGQVDNMKKYCRDLICKKLDKLEIEYE